MILSSEEESLYKIYKEMKDEAGTHAPSIHELMKRCPQIKIDIDACFLCNPYAFDLFMEYFSKVNLEKYIKFYPPQNHEIASNISIFNKIPAEKILVGNGAIEIIQSLFGRFSGKKIMITMPSFSTYYEISRQNNTVIPYYLSADHDFNIDILDYINFISRENPDVVVIINPNNPTGSIINKSDLIKIHKVLRPQQLLIIDESFIHFSSEDHSLEGYSIQYENIVIIRSLSKDFGIAGIRLGYAVMTEQMVNDFNKFGYLWNSNGLAYYFTELLKNNNFMEKYANVRALYNTSRDDFFKKLQKQNDLMVYPSSSNFFLIQTRQNPAKLFVKLLVQHGIYTRLLNDKVGLNGNFIRIASKNQSENSRIINAFNSLNMGL